MLVALADRVRTPLIAPPGSVGWPREADGVEPASGFLPGLLRPAKLRKGDTHVATQSSKTLDWDDLDDRAVDTARILAADAVEKVGNGHPGTAMSLAPLAYLLFQKVMRAIRTTTSGSGATASFSRWVTAR